MVEKRGNYNLDIWKRAQLYREEVNKLIINDFGKKILIDLYGKYSTSSLYHSSQVLAPDIFSKEVVIYNLYLTDKACEKVLKENISIYEKILIYAHIIELSAREIYLNSPKKTIKHLAASKEYGYFFTPAIIAKGLVSSMKESKVPVKSVIDPACGAGTLLAFSLLENKTISEITGIEIDSFTAELARKLLNYIAVSEGLDVKIEIINEDAIKFMLEMIDKKDEMGKKWDFLIMNPPYGKMKFLESSLNTKQSISTHSREDLKKVGKAIRIKKMEKSEKIRSLLEGESIGNGSIDYSKLFIVLGSKIVRRGGILAAITPSTWLGDHQSRDLRKKTFSTHKLRQVIFFSEDLKLFQTVNQPTAMFHLICGDKTDVIDIVSYSKRTELDGEKSPARLPLSESNSLFPEEYKILKASHAGMKIIKKLSANRALKNYPNIVNLRGECDVTIYRDLFSKNSENSRLIRGDHIKRYLLQDTKDSEKTGYININAFKELLGDSPKLKYIHCWRIAGPQCSYMQKRRRMEFTLIPPGNVLANSTNFILVEKSKVDKLDEIHFLLGCLNSAVLEWYFRNLSSNNHIGNYELASLPIPEVSKKIKEDISRKVSALISLKNDKSQDFKINELEREIEALIAKSYKLNFNEFKQILKEIEEPNNDAILDLFFGHVVTSLSEMDLNIIQSVPPGGNWQNIPLSIKSKRIDQIREMSKERGVVRTSYYGRLRSDQPAYTIATYFNRPGNGTNIHPYENRTLTLREAARLQSFPDNFSFIGSEGEIRKQIGNAVPPLLAFSLGNVFSTTTCVDLFSGAGGLSYGFHQAGHDVLVGQEMDKSAASTFLLNHSKAEIIAGDIADENVQKLLIDSVKSKLNGKPLGILMGGPPCQGFSTAGWRNLKDSRNSLVRYFFKIAHELKPNYILIENVPGILSMEKGKILSSIQTTLKQLGYNYYPVPWLLNAEQYGVPQMRKRVIIVASREGLPLPPMPCPIFSQCKGRREVDKGSLVRDLPYPISAGEALLGLNQLGMEIHKKPENIKNFYSKVMAGEINFEEFLSLYQKRSADRQLTLPLKNAS